MHKHKTILISITLLLIILPLVQASHEYGARRFLNFSNTNGLFVIDSIGRQNATVGQAGLILPGIGLLGSAGIQLNGTSATHYLNITNFTTQEVQSPQFRFTTNFFINTTQTNGGIDNAFFSITNSNAAYRSMELIGNNTMLRGGGLNITINATINDGRWHMITHQWHTDTEILEIYIDAALQVNVTGYSSPGGNYNWHFGMINPGIQNFSGRIDSVYLRNDTLNGSELLSFNNTIGCAEGNFSTCHETGTIANLTTNLTSLRGLIANYSITFDANTSNTPDQCTILFSNNNSIIQGTYTNQVCSINFQANTSIDISITPRINSTTNTLFTGTAQPLVRVFRTRLYQNNTDTSHNETQQAYLIEHRIENRINRNHTGVPFAINMTSNIDTITVNGSLNISINSSFITNFVNASRTVANTTITVYVINVSTYNFTQNITTNASSSRDLNIPDALINVTKRGALQGRQLRSGTTTYNYTFMTEQFTFRILNATANATTNLTFEWQGFASRLWTDPNATGVCNGDTREYTKADIVEILQVTGIDHQRAFSLNQLPNWANRATENIATTNGSITREFDASTYTYNITPGGTLNHTITITYGVTDATCSAQGGSGTGGGGGGGGGGGDDDDDETKVLVEQPLDIMPRFLAGLCVGFKAPILCNERRFTANKKINTCTLTQIINNTDVKNATCRILNNTAFVRITGGKQDKFGSTADAEFLIGTSIGELATIRVHEDIVNIGFKFLGINVLYWVGAIIALLVVAVVVYAVGKRKVSKYFFVQKR